MTTVSVIIPTYNRRAYVQEAIDSVLAQTYTDYEIIVIEDGSTDGTGEALRERYGDQICYEWQENAGPSVARNRGIELAQGKYIAFLDSDDLWLPEKLAKQVAYLEEHPEVGLVFSEAFVIDDAGDVIDGRRMSDSVEAHHLTLEAQVLENHIPVPSSVIVSMAITQRVGGFDPAIRNVEDYDFLTRVCQHTTLGFIPEPLAKYRVHGDNVTQLSARYNEQSRRGHLSTLSKVFSAWPDAPPGLKQRAFAWQYAKSALMEAAVGNVDQVHACLAQALARDDWFLKEPERFLSALASYAAIAYEMGTPRSIKAGEAVCHCVIATLRSLDSSDRALVRKARARTYEALGFAAHKHRDGATVLRSFPMSLVLNPSLARNRGVWSILFDSIVGSRVSSWRIVTLVILAAMLLTAWPVAIDAQRQASEWSTPEDVAIITGDGRDLFGVLLCDRWQNTHLLWGKTYEGGSAIYYRTDIGGEWTPPIDVLAMEGPVAVGLSAMIASDDVLHVTWQNQWIDGAAYYSSVPILEASIVRSWSLPEMIHGGGRIIEAPDGSLHRLFGERAHAGFLLTVYHAQSDDRGDSWGEPSVVWEIRTSVPSIIDPLATIDGHGRIHVGVIIRSDDYGVFSELGYLRSPDGGRTWDPYRVVQQSTPANSNFSMLAPYAFDTDEIHLTWHAPARMHMWSADGGVTWSDPVEIMDLGAAFGGWNQLARDSAGNTHVVTTVFGGVYTSRWDGTRWSQSEIVDSSLIDPHAQDIVTCRGNELLVVYDDRHGEDATVWLSHRLLDAPSIPRTELPHRARKTIAELTDEPGMVADFPAPTSMPTPIAVNQGSPTDAASPNAHPDSSQGGIFGLVFIVSLGTLIAGLHVGSIIRRN